VTTSLVRVSDGSAGGMEVGRATYLVAGGSSDWSMASFSGASGAEGGEERQIGGGGAWERGSGKGEMSKPPKS
jgi:hypothetical protein